MPLECIGIPPIDTDGFYRSCYPPTEGDKHRAREDELKSQVYASRGAHLISKGTSFFYFQVAKAFAYWYQVVSEDITINLSFDTQACPDEVWILICKSCDVATLKNLRLVNKRMSCVVLPYLMEFVHIFEFACGERNRYDPVAKSLISTCSKYTKSFTYKTVGIRSRDIRINNLVLSHRTSFPEGIYLLNDRPWEKLTHIRLDYLFVESADLYQTLELHGPTLKSVILYKPTLYSRCDDGWVCFFQGLRDAHECGCMSLEKLDLQGWLQWTTYDEAKGGFISDIFEGATYPYKASSTQCDILTEYDELGRLHLYKSTLQQCMERYVIKGGNCLWNHPGFPTEYGPLQGFWVAEKMIENDFPGAVTNYHT